MLEAIRSRTAPRREKTAERKKVQPVFFMPLEGKKKKVSHGEI